MKRKFKHPAPPASEQANGPRYWRSLDELADTPGFRAQLEREFPEGAASLQGVDRRHFFKLMAASFALGGIGLAAGCRRPEENILPYGKSVEGVIPGLPQYYATAMPLRHGAIPLLAETHQGRPTKLEGNPTYARYGGATSLMAQASLLELYDPDRATAHTIKGAPADPDAVNKLLTAISTAYSANQGAGLAFLAEPSTSPSRARMVAVLRQKFSSAVWAEFDPTPDESSAPATAVFGQPNLKPVYHFDRARRILSLDSDFLQEGPHALAYARDFAKGRRVTGQEDAPNMNRLYVVESNFTITGSMADHRLRVASGEILMVAAGLAGRIAVDPFAKPALPPEYQSIANWLDVCLQDLREHKGASLVVAGAHQPAEVHRLVHALNVKLGNYGQTVNLAQLPDDTMPDGIGDLAAAITTGTVKTLVILGGNPAYNAPADLNFAALAKKVPEVVRLGYYADETSQLAGAHLGAAHFLESWGDARTADGTIVPVQPMILPLFNGLTELEVLARLADEPTTDPYAIVRTTFQQRVGDDAEKAFRKFLHDGMQADTNWSAAEVPAVDTVAVTDLVTGLKAPVALSEHNLEVRFVADLKVDDGRFANNGWLQECPHPITKLTWDNAISVSPRLGKQLGIDPKGKLLQVARTELSEMDRGREFAFVGELTLADGKKVRGPLHIQPGLADWTVILPLGYGRTVAGRVGNGAGHNFYPARTAAAPHFVAGAKLAVIADPQAFPVAEAEKAHYTFSGAHWRYELGTTQEHWSMEGRDLVREANLDEVTAPGGAGLAFVQRESLEEPRVILGEVGEAMTPAERATEIPRGNSLYVTPTFDGVHQWGMSIDLNTCIGCNACVVACQAENNIPIVGKDQVMRGRAMHWIRLDRYYADGEAAASPFGGDGNRVIPEDPQSIVQPVACQHCELAPCETVCPVNATVHDPEGINTMAYNRCIGTRYCANNCPYKVRRFNYFDFNKRSIDSLYLGPLGPSGMPELAKLAKNPEVSVRMRGVMEKCTYCIQRVQLAKIAQKRTAGSTDEVEVPDGTIKTACQQVCPVEAIVFGNIKDPKSAVSQAKARDQDYSLLGYLNIRPRTTYLGKLRNPNKDMPGYAALPFSRQEFNAKNHPPGFKEEAPEPKAPEKKPEAGKTARAPGSRSGGLS
jgi:molybdopterin-containing oxidoreductase family iron-sulfur binding subunit